MNDIELNQFINSPFTIGSLKLTNRLIQGPLAGFSCAPFRELFSLFHAPAYAVSEMLSARSVLFYDDINGRFLYRSSEETTLCYQLSGTCPVILAEAALKLQNLGADLIDVNCGCPKPKIRKKGAGSALLENYPTLIKIVKSMKSAIRIPLTIKIRLQDSRTNIYLAHELEEAGADALIVHGRTWKDDYDKPSNLADIAEVKQAVSIPVIANGDINSYQTLKDACNQTGCDAYMVSRAGTGRPWIFQELLTQFEMQLSLEEIIPIFFKHIRSLSTLENEMKAVLQARSLIRYYFGNCFNGDFLARFYQLTTIEHISCLFNDFSRQQNSLK